MKTAASTRRAKSARRSLRAERPVRHSSSRLPALLQDKIGEAPQAERLVSVEPIALAAALDDQLVRRRKVEGRQFQVERPPTAHRGVVIDVTAGEGRRQQPLGPGTAEVSQHLESLAEAVVHQRIPAEDEVGTWQ